MSVMPATVHGDGRNQIPDSLAFICVTGPPSSTIREIIETSMHLHRTTNKRSGQRLCNEQEGKGN